jgi:hypothetical protein
LLPLLLAQAIVSCTIELFTRPSVYLGKICAHMWLMAHPLAVLRHRLQSVAGSTVHADVWLRELSGTVRGRGGAANKLALLWCRALRIPHREDSKLTRNGPAAND